MERVKKGQKYYGIRIYKGEICVFLETEEDTIDDRINFLNGNYFHSREEAEAMRKKLRAVLAGADVIEMPSEDELKNAMPDSEPNDSFGTGQRIGWRNCYAWLKSKIVK